MTVTCALWPRLIDTLIALGGVSTVLALSAPASDQGGQAITDRYRMDLQDESFRQGHASGTSEQIQRAQTIHWSN
jgi:hypothetical protein